MFNDNGVFSTLTRQSRRRHLKCDEGKPSCRRCLRDRWQCDGYEQFRSQPDYSCGKGLSLSSSPLSSSSTSSQGRAGHMPGTSLLPALADGILLSSTDNALYYHARKVAIPDLEIIGGSRGFWHDIVLPLSHSNEPIKHALCALGVSHRCFMASYPGNLTDAIHDTDYDCQAVQKYSEAISYIKPLMAESSEDNIKTTLICCAVFICIESLHRRYADSDRHLRAGLQLLDSFRETVRPRWATPEGPSDQLKYQDEHDFLDLLTKMFSSFSQNVAVFIGDDSFSHLQHQTQVPEMGQPKTPFSGLAEAEDLLSSLNSFYDSFLFRQKTSICDASHMHPVVEWFTLSLNASRPLFQTWSSRFQLFKARCMALQLPPQEQRRVAMLSLHQATWSAFINMDSFEAGFEREDYRNILERIEAIVSLEDSGTRPLFTFGGHLVSELSTICASCKDADIRNKAISLLRSMRRREGVWDSWEVANVYEELFEALQDDRLDWEVLPWGFIQLIERIISVRSYAAIMMMNT
ncbi:hypothetical protein NM208_g1795 [Fusarium decemcellulare]|uniref:Uncharacterized protein n=1 Tax=Fusarium decemcellulare TaxID=57161 RepID=A0ACC1SUN1_9HYPO|nr:hypothetical protein NM208_g1795 [Fusarium decemcellulare]